MNLKNKKQATLIITFIIILIQMFSPIDILISNSIATSNYDNAQSEKQNENSIREDYSVEGKHVASMEIVKFPKDLTYDDGEKLDFSEGTIKMVYNDENSSKEETINNLIDTGVIKVDSEYASSTNRKATFTYAKDTSVTLEMPYYTLSDVKNKVAPSPLMFEEGEKISFASGILKLIYTNCRGDQVVEDLAIPLNIAAGVIKKDKEIATNSDTTLKLTYQGYDIVYGLVVTDPVTGVAVMTDTKEKVQALVAKSNSENERILTNDPQIRLGDENETEEEGEDPEVTETKETLNIEEPSKKIYKYGEELELADGKIITGDVEEGEISLDKLPTSAINGYNPYILGLQTVTVTYEGKSAEFEVEVKDYVESIIFTPSTINEELNTTLDEIFDKYVITYKVKYASKTMLEEPVLVTKSSLENTEIYDKESTEEQSLKILYKDTNPESITFNSTVQGEIKVKLTEKSISAIITNLPTKLNYLVGEPLDLTGGIIEITDKRGDTIIKSLNELVVLGYDTYKIGTQELNVMYEGENILKLEVVVTDYAKELNIIAPNKTTYNAGEILSLEGGMVQTIMASGALGESINMLDSMVSGYDLNKVGIQDVIVTYMNLTGSFKITVNDIIKEIALERAPDKIRYGYGENLDLTGATISVIRASGSESISVEESMVSGYNPYEVGMQTITITYEGFTATFSVTVQELPNENLDNNQNEESVNNNTQSNQGNIGNQESVSERNSSSKPKSKPKKLKAQNFNGFTSEPIRTVMPSNSENETSKTETNSNKNSNNTINSSSSTSQRKTETLGVQDRVENTNASILPYTIIIIISVSMLAVIFKDHIKLDIGPKGNIIRDAKPDKRAIKGIKTDNK